VGEHRLSAGWLLAAVGLALFGGGVALGATRESPRVLHAVAAPPTIAKPQAVSVEAVVMGRRPTGFIARTRAGDLVVVRTDESTTYRLKGKDADANAIRRGARVLILGRTTNQERVIRARVVTVRGMIPPPAPPPEAIDLAR
jgi:hypothetical protein